MHRDARIRQASPEDVPTLLNLIRGLAEYERLLDQCVATEELLVEHLFGTSPKAFACLLEEGGTPVGYALWFFNFSTFRTKPGAYLEDLFVVPEARGKGYGKALISYVARFAVDHDCPRFEWSVLDWNTPSIDFYEALGAEAMDQWTVFRLTGEPLHRLAQHADENGQYTA